MRGGTVRKEKKELWIVTYADTITLLFSFFLIFIAISEVNYAKYDQLRKGLLDKSSPFAKDIVQREKVREAILKMIKEEHLENQVVITDTSIGMRLAFPSTMLFDRGRADLKEDAKKVLDKFWNVLHKAEYKEIYLAIKGHTDDLPINNPIFPSNWELSGARAARVATYLINKGFDPTHVKIEGYADTRPVEKVLPEDPPEVKEKKRAKNRRVEIEIIYYKDKF